MRRAGAGRPRTEVLDPSVVPALKALVDPETRGDPESPLRWTTKSARNLSDALTQAGHVISPDTVERLLNEDGYSLQGNAKTVEGKQHPDRDNLVTYRDGRRGLGRARTRRSVSFGSRWTCGLL